MGDNTKRLMIDIADVLKILTTNAGTHTQTILEVITTELCRLRTIEAAAIAATKATTKEEKTAAWQKLLNLVQ